MTTIAQVVPPWYEGTPGLLFEIGATLWGFKHFWEAVGPLIVKPKHRNGSSILSEKALVEAVKGLASSGDVDNLAKLLHTVLLTVEREPKATAGGRLVWRDEKNDAELLHLVELLHAKIDKYHEEERDRRPRA